MERINNIIEKLETVADAVRMVKEVVAREEESK